MIIQLLVSSEDPNHLAELKRFLERLRFSAFDDSFSCNRNDLERWLASSRQCFALDKWSSCRLIV